MLSWGQRVLLRGRHLRYSSPNSSVTAGSIVGALVTYYNASWLLFTFLDRVSSCQMWWQIGKEGVDSTRPLEAADTKGCEEIEGASPKA